jgi:hypothetical protein
LRGEMDCLVASLLAMTIWLFENGIGNLHRSRIRLDWSFVSMWRQRQRAPSPLVGEGWGEGGLSLGP